MVSTLWALHVISVFYICAPFTDNFFQTCTLLLQWSQLFHFTSALLILDDLFLKANMPPNPWDLEATACGIHSALSDVTIWQWSLINHIQKVLVLKVLRKYMRLYHISSSLSIIPICPPAMNATKDINIGYRIQSWIQQCFKVCCGWNLRYNDLQGHYFSVYHDKMRTSGESS